MVKKFTIPFASQGDANDIPDALQVDGKVSYTQGFGYDYERPYDDPQSKDINREDMNGLFKAITSAIGEMQMLGASEYDKSLKYPKGAIVYYNKDLYISQVDDNINAPPQQWTSIKNIADDSLKKVMNLSDLTNVAEARKNLGLGNSATLNKTDVLGASSDLLATQKLVNDTNTNLTNEIAKKWDTQATTGTGNIVRKSITDSLDTRVASAHNRADSAYNLANSKWSPQETVGSGKLMRESAYGLSESISASSENSFLKDGIRFGKFDNEEIKGIEGKRWNGFINISYSREYGSQIIVGNHNNLPNRAFIRTADESFEGGFRPAAEFYTTFNTTTDKSGFLRAIGTANALTESDRTSSFGTSTTLVASQKLVNDTRARADSAYNLANSKWSPQDTQGTGAIARMSEVQKAQEASIGYGQKWVDVTSQRSAGTTYVNNTGKPIMVSVSTGLVAKGGVQIYVDGIKTEDIVTTDGRDLATRHSVSSIIPKGSSYVVTVSNTNINIWAELR